MPSQQNEQVEPVATSKPSQTSPTSHPQPAKSHSAHKTPSTIFEEPDRIDPSLGTSSSLEAGQVAPSDDPYLLRGYIRDTVQNKSTQQVIPTRAGRKQKKIKKYYNRQNALIDAYLGSGEEEQFEINDTLKNGGKVKFAVNASFVCNFFLFIIQMYAAVSTGSLSLFATAADAFVSRSSPICQCDI